MVPEPKDKEDQKMFKKLSEKAEEMATKNEKFIIY